MHPTSVINLKITILLLISSSPTFFLHFISLYSLILFEDLSFSINQLLYVVGVTLMRGVPYLAGVGHNIMIWKLFGHLSTTSAIESPMLSLNPRLRQDQLLSYNSLFLNVH